MVYNHWPYPPTLDSGDQVRQTASGGYSCQQAVCSIGFCKAQGSGAFLGRGHLNGPVSGEPVKEAVSLKHTGLYKSKFFGNDIWFSPAEAEALESLSFCGGLHLQTCLDAFPL